MKAADQPFGLTRKAAPVGLDAADTPACGGLEPAADTPGQGGGKSGARLISSLTRSVGARAVTLPVTAVTNLVMSHSVVGAVGVSGYAFFTLVTTLPAMLPVTDLGAGAAIVEACARDQSRERTLVRRTVSTAARNLLGAGVAIALAGVALGLLGMWDRVLGSAAQPGSNVVAAVAAVLYGCSVPLGVGRAVLLAVNRNDVAFLLLGAGSVLQSALVMAAASVGASTAVFICAAFFSQLLTGLVSMVVTGRLTGLPLLRLVVRSARHSSSSQIPFAQLAVPMTVITAATVVAYGTDRLVLSHMDDANAVAQYSAGAQFFSPATSLLAAAALPLWALFAQRRQAEGSARKHLARLTVYFALGGLVMGAGLIVVGPVLGSWMLHGQVRVGTDLMAAFAALLFVRAASYPANMWSTDASGLRFQAIAFSLMTVANIALSIPLAQLGAHGPVIGSVLSYTFVVLVPSLIRAHRRA
ncbi:hypothetical protein JS756_33025 [Streptomyces actuosus]|uniref:Polysaccharide biosynthesis protein n=1 Tax=Streptomyces actuosus TaxID=1885 RepID=A0ABS2W089_STRAS|nr:hypothetical protein [Streptomyces actuosus]MBN0048822.1 hypothetical protein [Streptomyces actuosus]